MNLVTWILFGLLVGISANILDPKPSQGGVIGAAIIGMSGALVGGLVATSVFGFGITGFNFTSFAVAILGALFLLLLGRAFSRT